MATALAADDIIPAEASAIDAAASAEGAEVQLSDVEQLAVEMGWKPHAEYTGTPERWKPAKDYVLAERELARSMKNTIRGLKDQVDRLAVAGSKQTERALQRQADEINARFEKAVETGDAVGARKAERDLVKLEREAVSETMSAEEGFARDNPWYGKDEDASAYAVSITQREAGKGKSIADQLEAAREGVRKRFPELFDAPPVTKAPPIVNAPGSRAAGLGRAKGYADLPGDAKAAAGRYAELFKQKFGTELEKSKAEFAKDYWENKGDA